MKTVRLSLVIALSALGLQACDVSVKPTQNTAAAPQSTQPAAPADATPTPVGSADASAAATPSAPVAAADSNTAPAAAPDTNAMGAQPGAPAASDGVAAPTELARFFEQNPIKPKAQ